MTKIACFLFGHKPEDERVGPCRRGCGHITWGWTGRHMHINYVPTKPKPLKHSPVKKRGGYQPIADGPPPTIPPPKPEDSLRSVTRPPVEIRIVK